MRFVRTLHLLLDEHDERLRAREDPLVHVVGAGLVRAQVRHKLTHKSEQAEEVHRRKKQRAVEKSRTKRERKRM